MKALFIIALISLTACKDSGPSSEKHNIVTLYGADGKQIHQWESNGKVRSEINSDVWWFKDAASGEYVRITGTVVVEKR